MAFPESWADAAFSYSNTTREQRAKIAEIQSALGVYPPDGLPGTSTWEAVQGRPDAEVWKARIDAVLGGCEHPDVVAVRSGTEVVAWLCTSCDAQLPAQWRE